MATNWNEILSNTKNLNDVLSILKKVLAGLDAKADSTTIDEAVLDIEQLKVDVGVEIENVTTALDQFQIKADEIIAQGFFESYATETALIASLPAVSEMRARADDTRKIWRWSRTSAEGVTPVTGTWTDTGLSDKDLAAVDATTKANAAEANAKTYFDSSIKVSYPNLYEVAPKTSNMYVGAATLVTTADAALVGFPIEVNKTYLIKAPAFMSAALRYVGLAAAGSAVNGKAITKRDLLPTSEPDVYKFSTTSADAAFTQAFFTTKLVSQNYDVRDTVSIFEGFISQDLSPYVSRVNDKPVAKPQNPRAVSRFENLKVWAAGDSKTQGTTTKDENNVDIVHGTYVEQLAKAFGTYINNHGSSGATSARIVDIITAGSGIAQRDSPQAWGPKDATDLACFTLMGGTNDANLGLLAGSIDQLPNGKFQDYATANDYAALFPNNYLCNFALLIEYIRWKSPKCEIHIIAPPYRNRPAPFSDLPSKMTNVLPYLEAVCRHYAVHLIYGIYECGIGYKAMSPLPNKLYSYDGVHFTKLGNEVFGKFVAQKVLSFG